MQGMKSTRVLHSTAELTEFTIKSDEKFLLASSKQVVPI